MRFSVNVNTGSITGPVDYMASEAFKVCKAKIENGSHVLLATAPAGTPFDKLLAVIFQTDYAAWKGLQETFSTLR